MRPRGYGPVGFFFGGLPFAFLGLVNWMHPIGRARTPSRAHSLRVASVTPLQPSLAFISNQTQHSTSQPNPAMTASYSGATSRYVNTPWNRGEDTNAEVREVAYQLDGRMYVPKGTTPIWAILPSLSPTGISKNV
jgi:hypothetical protein